VSGGLDQSEKIHDRTPGRPRSISAPVKGPSVRTRVSRTAGVEMRKQSLQTARWHVVRIAVFGKLLGNVSQHGRVRRIDHSSQVSIGLLPRLSPEPKSGEHHRTVGQSTACCIRSGLPRFYRTSTEESGSGVCRLANAPGRRHSSQAATNTVSTTAASWVMLPASAPSSKESTRAPSLLLASKI
jgi:hypothetical protein